MQVVTLAASCKCAAFAEEEEYRVVVHLLQDPLAAAPAAPACDFRVGRFGITPYLKLRFSELNDALAGLTVGPAADAGANPEPKLRLLLANAGIKPWSSFPITRCGTTYRAI
jgi:hypothetical protein